MSTARIRWGLSLLFVGLAAFAAVAAPAYAEEPSSQLGEPITQDSAADSEASLSAASDFQVIKDSAAYDIPNGVYDRESAYAVLGYVNDLRAQEGASALTWDSDLEAAALVRARELVELNSHTRPDGSSCFTAFPDGGSTSGENIASGTSWFFNSSMVFNAWKNSSGHRANMVSTSYRSVGMACFVSGGTRYWVQCFSGASGDGQRFTSAGSADGTQKMLRLYNPNSGEHFYTANTYERDVTAYAGWTYEGVGWTAPTSSNAPVYRLYNKNGGEHHYTTSTAERDNLVKVGWTSEGIGWYSDDTKRVPLLREYNPNQFSCNHNYTASQAEHKHLISIGWKDEGIGWYGVA